MSHLDAVRHVLSLSPNAESSRHFVESRHCFIWEDVEECIEQWNHIAAVPYGLEPVTAVWSDDGKLSLQRHGSNTPVRLFWNATDGLLVIHALSLLVKKESEFRYCIYSWPESQRAFAALPPKVWAELDTTEEAATRFASLPDDCDRFVREMITKRPFFQQSGSNPPPKPWWRFW